MSKIKELQQFPTIFTFKIVVESGDEFKEPVKKLFDLPDKEVEIKETESTGGKYVSFSITTVIMDYEELEKFYKEISMLKGLKFYV